MNTPLWPPTAPPALWRSLQDMIAQGIVPSTGQLLALLQQVGALTTATLIQTGTGLTGGPIAGAGLIRLADAPAGHVLANLTGGAAAPVPVPLANLLADLPPLEGSAVLAALGYTPLNRASNLGDLADAVEAMENVSGVTVVNTLATAKALVARPPVLVIKGKLVAGDGWGGVFFLESGSAEVADEVMTFRCTVGVPDLYRRLPDGLEYNMGWSGAKSDFTDPVTAQVNAVLAAANGTTVFVPRGSYRVASKISRNASVNLSGVSMGAGPGASTNVETSQFSINYSNDYTFEIEDFIGSSFRDLKFNVEPPYRPMSAGGGVKLKAPGGLTVGSPVFERCAFISLWNGVEIEAPAYARFEQCYAEVWLNSAIRLVTKAGVEGSGGHINGGHFFGDTTPGNTKGPAVYTEVGYLTVDGGACLLGGSQGIHFKPTNNPAGSLQVGYTHIEEQIQAGITCEKGNAHASMVQVIGAEFSVIANGGASFRSHLEIKSDAGGSWIDDVLVMGTMTRSRLAATSWFFDIQSGSNVVLTDLVNEGFTGNLGGGVRIGSQVTKAAVIEFKMLGAWPGTRYSLTAETLLIDTVTGLTASEVNAITCRDGSRVWVADGLAGSNPLSGGGTGTYAERIGGVWASAPSLRGANTWTGANTFKSAASGSNVTTWRNFTNSNELMRIYDDAGNGLLSLYDPSAVEKIRLFAAGQSFLAGPLSIQNASAIPAGGASGFGYLFTSTANFGIFPGIGVPTLSAAKGSLYLRADGSAANNRMYINTDGATGWTPVTTSS